MENPPQQESYYRVEVNMRIPSLVFPCIGMVTCAARGFARWPPPKPTGVA